MAGQIPTRREVLEALAMLSLASFAPRFTRWSAAQQPDEHHHTPPLVTPASTAPYVPIGFDAAQYRTVEHLCDMILPADGQLPGAAAAGASEFVDFMVAHDPTLQAQFLAGLKTLNTLSHASGNAAFIDLLPAQQTSLLTRLAYRKHFRPGDESARAFFHLIRKYTVIGFYTSEVGYQALDSPNLKFYSESPGCPDPSDASHIHAKVAGA